MCSMVRCTIPNRSVGEPMPVAMMLLTRLFLPILPLRGFKMSNSACVEWGCKLPRSAYYSIVRPVSLSSGLKEYYYAHHVTINSAQFLANPSMISNSFVKGIVKLNTYCP